MEGNIGKLILDKVEEQLDDELDKLTNLDSIDFESLRQARIKKLKKQEEDKKKWLSLGHGEYRELQQEKDIFTIAKQSDKVVVCFFKHDYALCEVLETNLKFLASRHIETRFVKLNAQKCPFLTEKWNMKIFPVIFIMVNNVKIGKIHGLEGWSKEYTREMLEWDLAKYNVINCEEDLLQPPVISKKTSLNFIKKKTIRDDYSDSESD